MAVISHHTALIYVMVLMSAADREMTDAELRTIGDIVRNLPIFKDYDAKQLTKAAQDCAELLAAEDGLKAVLGLIAEALPEKLTQTAYALACDVAAADLYVGQEEMRLLEIIRHRLGVGRLAAAAIERGARVRHVTL